MVSNGKIRLTGDKNGLEQVTFYLQDVQIPYYTEHERKSD